MSSHALQRCRAAVAWTALAWTALPAIGCGDNLGAGAGGPTCELCAPDAGPPDAGPLAAYCDDGNPCTADTVDGDGGGCRFDALADGLLCEDGDLCTLGDRCESGECAAGPRAEGELAVVGRLDNLAGKRIPLAPGRFVVITAEDLFRARIQVVSPTEGGLATLSSWQGLLTLVILGDEDILADAIEETGVVAVAAASDRTLRLFSASDAEVAPRGQIELGNQILSLDGHGDRLWLCTFGVGAGYQVTLVDIADPDAPIEVGGMALGPTACGSLAIGADGDRVYVNTADGVRFVDATPLDTGGDPILSDIIAPPSGVAISGSHLLLMAPTEVRILNQADLEEVATVPVARARAATLLGDRLLVEGNRPAGGDSELFVAWYQALGEGSPTLLDDAVTATFIGSGVLSSFRSATDGSTLLTGTRAYDLTRNRLDEVRLPELLPLRTLGRTASGLRAYHASGATVIEVDDPAAPTFVAGGAFAQPRPIITVALDDSLLQPTFAAGNGVSGLDDPTRVELDPSHPYFRSPLRIDRWTLDASADLLSEDWFSLAHEGPSQLATAGDFIYRFRRSDADAPSGALQAFWLPTLGGGEPAVPAFDLAVTGAAASARRGFDVDPRARVAVVSSEAPTRSGDLEPALLFYDLSSSPPTLVDQITTDSLYRALRVSGDRVVAVGSDRIVSFERGQGEVSRLTFDDIFELQLLAFDGTTAYLSQLRIVPGTATYSIAALPFGSLESPTLVEVDAIARSLVPLDSALAVGFDNQLLTIHPHCLDSAVFTGED